MFRFVCLFTVVAMCNAGIANYNGASVIAPTITSEQQNVLRSYGNLQQVSYNSKTIDTPYSSVSKSDVRVSNPGYQVTNYAAAPAVAYHAQPALQYAAQPAVHYAAQPAVVKQAAYIQPAAKVYSAPAPAVYSAPAHYAQPALAYSAPAAHSVVAAPAAKLLGVAYSPATAVSHMSYSAPLISYAW